MDRLAQSPLRLPVDGKKSKLQRKQCAYKPSKEEEEADNDASISRQAGRKRRLLQPLRSLTQEPSTTVKSEYEAALRRRDFERVLWMIESGDVAVGYETPGGETALLAAIGARDTDAFRLLMQCRGCAIDTPNRHGYTPLMKAIAAAAPFAEASPKPGSSRDEDATFDNSMVRCVLAHHPDFHARDRAGQTAFDWSTRTRNTAALALLEDHKRQLQQQHEDFDDRDARLRECLSLLEAHDSLARRMEALLREPMLSEASLVALVQETPASMTAETVAAARQDVVKLGSRLPPLLDGFVLTRETREGWTPLTKAAACGFLEAAVALLALGVDASYESRRFKHTALTWASCCGHEGVVLALLRHNGVDVAQQTAEGKTALLHAVANRQPTVVRHLLHAMHERSVRHTSGKEAFHVNEAAVLAACRDPHDSPRRCASRWGARPGTGTASGKRKPGADEWHDVFLDLLKVQDATGRDAWAYATMEDGDEAVRSELAHAMHQARDHAAYVATHQAKTLATPCKYAGDGCLFVAPLDLLPSHELYACAKRRVACERCGESIVELERTAHDARECGQRLVPCVNRQHGCEALVVLDERETHERHHCRKRRVACRLGCGEAALAFDTRHAHEAEQCPLRLVECVHGCGAAPFAANQRSRHVRKHCVKRLLPCVSGCGLRVAADQMDFHVGTLCELRRVACRWAGHGCTQWIGGAVESRRHHEQADCPFRLVACPHEGCEQSGELLACFLDQHCAWQCDVAPVACPHACGVDALPRRAMDAHVQSDAGDCSRRKTRCRLDLCGKTLRLYDVETATKAESMRGLRQRVERTAAFVSQLQEGEDDEDPGKALVCLSNATTRSFLLSWLAPQHERLQQQLAALERAKHTGAVRVRVLSFDFDTQRHLVEFRRDGHADWLVLAGREYDVEDEEHDAFRCGWLQYDQLASHEATECTLRLVPCPLACGQRLPAHSVAPHLAKRCSLRNATCRLGCGAVLSFLSLAEHEDAQCALRQVVCEHCRGDPLPFRALATHIAKHCREYPRRCRLGCAALVPSSRFHIHETTECPKRLVPCPQCDRHVWASEQASHLADECALRVYGACDRGCGRVLRVNERTHHLLHDCDLRELPCPQCHAVLQWRDLAHHRAMLCSQREVFCRRGCGARVKECDAAGHEDEQCSRRLVACPAQCGEPLVASHLHAHVHLQCAMRVVSCPHGCGDRLFAYQVEPHAVRCRQRLCECGTGARPCARPIRLWVNDRKLVRCAAHGETALLWAIKTGDEELVAYFTGLVDSVDVEFANGFTPLATAAALGDAAVAKLLLRVGGDVNMESSRGRTPLLEATLASDPAMVALLLEHRASVGHVNRHGQSAVGVAASLAAAAGSADSANANATRVLELLREQEELERDQRELFRAIACSDYAFVAALLRYSGEGETGEALAAQLATAQQQALAAQRELADGVAQLHESIADTEAKATQAQRLRERVADGQSQLGKIARFQEASEADSNALEADLLAHIREITALDLAKLLNTATPPAEYLVVMKSVCLLCGVVPRGRRDASEYTDLEWWKTAQALLMDRGLLSKLRAYRRQAVTPDVMAKVRRECLRTQAFHASTKAFSLLEEEEEEATPAETRLKGDLERMGRLPRRDALRGDIVGILATWARGVEMEYKASSERVVLADKKRRLAVALQTDASALDQAVFDMDVATRSLPARQQELAQLEALQEAAEKKLAAATLRLKAHRLLQYAALNGHTALSFASALGNDAMVHMLLTHGGGGGGVSRDEREACAALIQLTFRELLYRRRRQRERGARSRSDEAVAALVRNVAQTFLMGHYQRRLRLVQRTRRVAIHEAVYNGHAQVAAMLVAHGDAKLWHKTHVFPIRVVPGAMPVVAAGSPGAEELRKRGGWRVLPLTGTREAEETEATTGIDPQQLEQRLAPMTIEETLSHAVWKYDSRTFLRDSGGWNHSVTPYSETAEYVGTALAKLRETQATQRREILARKNVARKAAELKALHTKLEHEVLARDFHKIMALLDDGAFADYETSRDAFTPLMVACLEERYVENKDGDRVLTVDLLLDRASNRPFVNFESSAGHTALGIAASKGQTLCAQSLVERGADVNLVTRRDGETALMVAARHGQVGFVEYLLRHQATDVFTRDHDGKTALDYAIAGGFHAVQHLLGLAMGGGSRGRVFASASALYDVCKWGCGFMAPTRGHRVDEHSVVVEDTNPLELHETASCPKRIVACPRGCDISTLWAEEVESHLKSACPQRLVPCPQAKCGAQIVFCHLAQHNAHECEYRMILCECGDRMTYQKLVVHAQNQCPERFIPCPNQCLTADESKKEVVLVRFSHLKEHNRSECAHRRVRCRNGCVANELLFKEREHHETQHCVLRRVRCKWGCDEPVLANTQQDHETDECIQRQLACPNKCGEIVGFLALDTHTSSSCARRLTLCTLGCGRKVPLHLMETHCKSECRKRVVQCPQCSESLLEIDLAHHQSASCSLRLTVCGLCGQSNLPHAQLQHHRSDECRMRVVTCRFNCYATRPLLAHAKLHHEQFECTFRPMFCPLGCGETIIAHMLKKHEKSCVMRIVQCGNGCGVELREREREDHERRYCSASSKAASRNLRNPS